MGQNTNRDIKSFAIDNQGNTIDVVLNTDERFQTTTTLEERVEYLEQALGALLTQDGNVRIQKGGTSADNATDAVGNLVGGLPALSELTDEDYDIIVGRKRMTDMGAYKTTATALSDFIEGKLPPIPEPTQDFFTYIVDSNQKLADWANNVSGNDYTTVLIKKGVWTLTDIGINLTNTHTTGIVGEDGSLIKFSLTTTTTQSRGHCLFYEENNNSNWMFNVNIEFDKHGGIYHCSNLVNCKATLVSGAQYSYDGSDAFSMCNNLKKCVAICRSSNYIVCGFSSCNNLYFCNAEVYNEGTSDTSYIAGVDAFGFIDCNNLVGCSGHATIASYNAVYKSIYGFRNCRYVFLCNGGGVDETVGSLIGCGFAYCTNVSYCKKTIDKETQGVFLESYYSSTTNQTYACANTLEGGWNDTTIG